MKMRYKTKHNRIKDIFLLAFILTISPALWAATDTGKDLRQSPDDRYIIKNGDTLWDISEAYLKNPLLWPKIWKENRYILDPNLIYPGNRLNIPSTSKLEEIAVTVKSEELPATEEVEEKTSPVSITDTDTDKGELTNNKEKEEKAIPSRPEEAEIALEEEKVLPDKTIEPQVSDQKPIQQITPETIRKKGDLLSVGYIIADNIDGGLIVGSKDNRELLGNMDSVYIKVPKGETPLIGDSYAIVKRIKKVIHPKTGRSIGNLIRVLGTLKIVDVGENLVSADIIRSVDYISKGDRLIPYKPSSEAAFEMTSEKTILRGYIVETNDDKEAIGQFDIVYIDRGRRDGISPGDNFLIYREGGKTSGYFQAEKPASTEITVGRLRILSTQENTSTAEVIKSSDTIERGYIVEKVVE